MAGVFLVRLGVRGRGDVVPVEARSASALGAWVSCSVRRCLTAVLLRRFLDLGFLYYLRDRAQLAWLVIPSRRPTLRGAGRAPRVKVERPTGLWRALRALPRILWSGYAG